MKILHLNSYYIGSPFYKNIYDYQRINNCVDVYCHTFDSSTSLDDEKCILSCCYSKLDRFMFFRKHKKIFDDIQKKFKVNEYDIIHAHSLFNNGFDAYKIYKKHRTPYVVSVRNTDVNLFFRRLFFLRKTGINILINAKKVIFISPSYRDYVLNNFIPRQYEKDIKEKSIVIPNGVDDFWLDNINNHEKSINQIRVATAASIEKNKNQLNVCKSLELLKKKGFAVKYNLYGKIRDKNYFKKISKFEFVTYHGQLFKNELIKQYDSIDVFVMPSYFETFGLVYVEAMSQGIPLVYSKDQGFDNWFEDGMAGYSTMPNKTSDICSKILLCYKNYEKISQFNNSKCLSFRWSLINDLIFDTYLN